MSVEENDTQDLSLEKTTASAADEGEVKPEQTPAAQDAKPEQEKPVTKKQKFWQFVKFALFSASAGIIQFVTISTLFDWTGWLDYWVAFPIGLTLSVIWNFTFNRKFTFKASSNVPIAMVLVVIYNLIIVVPLSVGGEALVGLWGDEYGMVVTVINLAINFVTEFFWDKFIVFNDKVINKIEKKFSRKKKGASAEADATDAQPAEQTEEQTEEQPSNEEPENKE